MSFITINYRVSHFGMDFMNWLWRIKICKVDLVWRSFWNAEIGNFWVPQLFFKKSNISWPQQPPTERVPDISKKSDFCWSIPWKGASIGHIGARDDLTIRTSNFFDEMRLLRSLRPLRLLRLLRSLRLLRF